MASKGAVSGAASAEQAVQASSERAVKGPPVILASKAATVAAVVAGAERSASKAAEAAAAAKAAGPAGVADPAHAAISRLACTSISRGRWLSMNRSSPQVAVATAALAESGVLARAEPRLAKAPVAVVRSSDAEQVRPVVAAMAVAAAPEAKAVKEAEVQVAQRSGCLLMITRTPCSSSPNLRSAAATAALAATAACRARVLAGVLPAPGSYRALRRTLPNQGQTEGHRMASTSEAHRPRTSRSRVRISPVESAGTLATPPSQACLVSPPRATIS